MAHRNNNLAVWLKTNAWREIFSRIFEGVKTEINTSPEWLINPATNRRLKLDMFYPEIGVAVRFEGLHGKNRRQRPSLEEEEQQRVRDNARVAMCQAHGIELILIDMLDEDPHSIFRDVDLRLSRAGQRLASVESLQLIKRARTTGSNISRQVKVSRDLKLYAELWQDRLYQVPEPSQTPSPTAASISFTAGMEVEHIIFGPGVVLAVAPGDADTFVTVDFVTAGQKTLAASLIGDKLWPR